MKKLELNQMENLEGGLSNRQCMLAGIGLVTLAAAQFWAGFIGMTVASADCW